MSSSRWLGRTTPNTRRLTPEMFDAVVAAIDGRRGQLYLQSFRAGGVLAAMCEPAAVDCQYLAGDITARRRG